MYCAKDIKKGEKRDRINHFFPPLLMYLAQYVTR